jgi:hypothetical protein
VTRPESETGRVLSANVISSISRIALFYDIRMKLDCLTLGSSAPRTALMRGGRNEHFHRQHEYSGGQACSAAQFLEPGVGAEAVQLRIGEDKGQQGMRLYSPFQLRDGTVSVAERGINNR